MSSQVEYYILVCNVAWWKQKNPQHYYQQNNRKQNNNNKPLLNIHVKCIWKYLTKLSKCLPQISVKKPPNNQDKGIAKENKNNIADFKVTFRKAKNSFDLLSEIDPREILCWNEFWGTASCTSEEFNMYFWRLWIEVMNGLIWGRSFV